jgi:hypothetical protein
MLPNLGNGTFGPATSFAPIPFVANCFALADFDRDGDMDVAIGAVSQRLLLFFDNDGAGTFSFFNGLDLFYSLGGILKSLACADLDGDHFVDIVLFHEAFSAVPAGTWRGVVLRNQFQGHFAMPTNEPQFGVGLGVADVCTADLDGDGRTDFLVSNTADNAVTHLANFVNGVPLTNETLLVGATPYTPRGALGLDVDGDGDEDLIATHHGANSLSITGNCRINGVPFCFGDGTGTACPCSNDGAPGHGCANSVDPNGARLRASGGASLAHDSSQLLGDSMPDGPLLYFQGTALAASLAFGDGLKCTSGALIRLGIVFNAGHASVFPAESGTLATLGLVSGPGARHYQARYRDAASFCTLDTFNYTNGVTLLWVP